MHDNADLIIANQGVATFTAMLILFDILQANAVSRSSDIRLDSFRFSYRNTDYRRIP